MFSSGSSSSTFSGNISLVPPSLFQCLCPCPPLSGVVLLSGVNNSLFIHCFIHWHFLAFPGPGSWVGFLFLWCLTFTFYFLIVDLWCADSLSLMAHIWHLVDILHLWLYSIFHCLVVTLCLCKFSLRGACGTLWCWCLCLSLVLVVSLQGLLGLSSVGVACCVMVCGSGDYLMSLLGGPWPWLWFFFHDISVKKWGRNIVSTFM